MKRATLALSLLVGISAPAFGHFIWILPDAKSQHQADVVFSDDFAPDSNVDVKKIANFKAFGVGKDGKAVALPAKLGEHRYQITLPEGSPRVIVGTCEYGVLEKGKSKPYLLVYHAKLMAGNAPSGAPTTPLEIVRKDHRTFQVLFQGKPAPQAEIVIEEKERDGSEKGQTNADGTFDLSKKPSGWYGLRAKWVEAKAGEANGKKYEEIRHYATLFCEVKEEKTSRLAPLPDAVSSFGAVTLDGWVYIYGGHRGDTHKYSTDTVLGTFHRQNLSKPGVWETLPNGPSCQSAALVAHDGKIFRVGGMQPRNAPGSPTDNHSLASTAYFDPNVGKWQAFQDLPEGRSSHDVASVGDYLVVVGGWSMRGKDHSPQWMQNALILNTKDPAPSWKPLPQPFQRRALSAATHQGKVYVFGGMNEAGKLSLEVAVLDPKTKEWAKGPAIPGFTRNGFSPASVAIGGKLIVSGNDGSVYQLANDGGSWDYLAELNQRRQVHRIVADAKGTIYVLGGASNGIMLNSVEEVGFTPTPAKSSE